jgi:peptidoglycan/xylan/chitin deacetylase (PgdA/CDA1 family)
MSTKENTLRLPVLMYHEIHTEKTDHYSIHLDKLIAQFNYLNNNGYTTIFVEELLDYQHNNTPLPSNPVLITFDDGYKTIATKLHPVLLQLKMKATVFLVPTFIHEKENANNRYLSIPEIKKLAEGHIEWGIHSYNHLNFKKITVEEATSDIQQCIHFFTLYDIPMVPAFAFPYGAFPKFNLFKRKRLFSSLQSIGIKLFFRIGNRMNYFTSKDILFQRIDITGDETTAIFEEYLKKGKR